MGIDSEQRIQILDDSDFRKILNNIKIVLVTLCLLIIWVGTNWGALNWRIHLLLFLVIGLKTGCAGMLRNPEDNPVVDHRAVIGAATKRHSNIAHFTHIGGDGHKDVWHANGNNATRCHIYIRYRHTNAKQNKDGHRRNFGQAIRLEKC